MTHPNHDDPSGVRSTIIATVIAILIALCAIWFATRGNSKEGGPDSTSAPFLF